MLNQSDSTKSYRVTAAADGSVRIAGRFPREGETVRLTEREAVWELRRGLVQTIDPLDHDGDGRKGGSLPGKRRAA